MPLHDLPPETLAAILVLLHPRDAISSLRVSRFWNDLLLSSPDIKYRMELWRDGLIFADSLGLTPTESLERLYRRRKVWRSLMPVQEHTIPMQSMEVCRAYELGGGLFALQEDTGGFVRVPFARLMDANAADAHAVKETSELPVPMAAFKDFAMDPGQDLLVNLSAADGEVKLELTRLSEPLVEHPEAKTAVFRFQQSAENAVILTIQILDDIIVVFFRSGARFLVFDWRKGELVVDRSWDEDHPEYNVSDCFFITPRSFFLACVSVRGPQFQHGCLRLFSLSMPNGAIKLLVALNLPYLAESDPDKVHVSTMWVMAPNYTAVPAAGLPYYQSNERRIFSIAIQYSANEWVRLVLHARTLLRLVEKYQDYADPDVLRAYRWEEWGPMQTRMFRGMPHLWPRHVHGERMALPTRNARYIQYLDFNTAYLCEPEQPIVRPDSPASTDPVEHNPSRPTSPSPLDIFPDFVPTPDDDDDGDDDGEPFPDDAVDVDVVYTAEQPTDLQMSIWVSESRDEELVMTRAELFRIPVTTSLPFRRTQKVLFAEDAQLERMYHIFLLEEDHIVAANAEDTEHEVTVFRMG
ncbi:F-box domain-containing protein [Mycena kentingensis (nom. inval.)]|nr:F-box domain-containing protein [Mycena kentingensis (nom. inval.)]